MIRFKNRKNQHPNYQFRNMHEKMKENSKRDAVDNLFKLVFNIFMHSNFYAIPSSN